MLHKFVEFIPEKLENEVIYISMYYATAVHKCACGCGSEVVTPFSPTDWKLTFNGESISLHPSIGNWSFQCKSHYWIRNNRIQWASNNISEHQINSIKNADKINKENYYIDKEKKKGSLFKKFMYFIKGLI